jgi:phosphoglycerol transferase MdoB-like AlkP superfamily enzyme
MASEVHVHPPAPGKKKNTTQMISIIVGFVLFVLGLAGLLYPSFAGLHLSILHSLIISIAGGILFYSGFTDNSLRAFLCCLGFGLFFGIYSIVGFTLGAPGVPTVGYRAWDPYYIVIIPGFQELGQIDHVLNGIISLVLLGGALDWFKRHTERRVKKKTRPDHYRRRGDLAHR